MSAGCSPSSARRGCTARALASSLQLGRELDALRFTAAELGGGLAQAQVTEPDLASVYQAARGRRHVGEEVGASSTVIASTSATFLPRYSLEGLRVVARPLAGGARRVSSGQEEQLDGDEALPLARLAAPLDTLNEKRPAP